MSFDDAIDTPTPESALEHVAFAADGDLGMPGSAAGVPLERAKLADQQKLAIVFQGTAVLAHLWHLDRHLGEGLAETAWEGAEVDGAGLLRLPESRPGPAADLPQAFLFRLLQIVFGTDKEIAGRGPARRIARHLWGSWRQTLTRIPPDLAVAQVLDAAPFLWTADFARSRHYLGCEYVANGVRRLWVVGPGSARSRLLEQGEDWGGLLKILGSASARDLWEGFDDDADPRTCFHQGRWQHAVVSWRRRPPKNREDRLAYARSLVALGRSNQALELLAQRRDIESQALRAWCQFHLGERHAAQKTVHRLEARWRQGEVDDAKLVQLAELGVRLAAGRGDREGVRTWVGRALSLRDEEARLAGLLVAAGAAWDLDEPAAAEQYLEQARPALDDPQLAHRWHQANGLCRLAVDDAPGAVEHVERALALRRRRCGRYEAARLWSDLTVARTAADDLAGAERAARHAVRLWMRCEGSSTTTLAFHNLAELRIRRGRFRGVEAELRQMAASNRRTGNSRGLLRDLELWCRYELALGRPRAALALAAEAREQRGPERSTVFDIFCARARGWLGDTAKAAAHFETGRDRLDQLEPEERPATWALAGELHEAAKAAAGGPWEPLWSALLGQQSPPSHAWQPLDGLEPYRAARLVFDIEKISPDTVPPSRVRWAIHVFRQVGAEGFVDALENRSSRPWQALRRFAEASDGLDGAAELLREAGYPEARLYLVQGDETRLLVGGSGAIDRDGEARLAVAAPASLGGVLELRHAFADPTLEALLALLARTLRETTNEDLDTLLGGSRSAASASSGSGIDGTGEGNGIEEEWRPTYHEGIIGRSPALIETLSRLDRLAVGAMPILVLGESGTGKELMARRVHEKSPRASGPFVPLNCAAISPALIQSELFGHVRGAFTGADRDRPGIFESARGGTVFLDEIGDLPLDLQPKLLRVLQEGEIRRVGESLPRKVDVRVVAATHRDLEQRVEAGEFREDLYYRLKAARVLLPSLREREDDVMILAEFFLKRLGDAELSPAAKRAIRSHHWPGNIRELKNNLETAAALAAGGLIEPEHLDLPEAIRTAAEDGTAPSASPSEEPTGSEPPTLDYNQQILDFKRQLIRDALRWSEGNIAKAARRLGMTRQNLSYSIRKHFEDDPLRS